jgi:DNA repair photolyase
MKRWGKLKPTRFDEKELKTDLGENNFIFVGSSCDMFAEDISESWINKTLNYCDKFNNKYLFQTKNPGRLKDYIGTSLLREKSIVCTTIETNRRYKQMGNTPDPIERARGMCSIRMYVPTYVTIEPIMKFDLSEMIKTIKICSPDQVNIGADSGNNNFPEPSSNDKILSLIYELKKFTIVKEKDNLKRLLDQ